MYSVLEPCGIEKIFPVFPKKKPYKGEGEKVEEGGGDAQSEGKQSRAQKKVMKAMSKLNLKKVPGIIKVVMRNSKKGNLLFSIHGGEVYKVRNTRVSRRPH